MSREPQSSFTEFHQQYITRPTNALGCSQSKPRSIKAVMNGIYYPPFRFKSNEVLNFTESLEGPNNFPPSE